jgi:hypothetical protein
MCQAQYRGGAKALGLADPVVIPGGFMPWSRDLRLISSAGRPHQNLPRAADGTPEAIRATLRATKRLAVLLGGGVGPRGGRARDREGVCG